MRSSETDDHKKCSNNDRPCRAPFPVANPTRRKRRREEQHCQAKTREAKRHDANIYLNSNAMDTSMQAQSDCYKSDRRRIKLRYETRVQKSHCPLRIPQSHICRIYITSTIIYHPFAASAFSAAACSASCLERPSPSAILSRPK